MKVVVVVQPRMGSTRLPGKVLLPLAGAPALQRQIERLQAVRTRIRIVVATTWDPADRSILALCDRLDVAAFAGHPTDLLDRHYRAAVAAGADVVVKVPSDCPLIDPAIVDRVLGVFLASPGRYDFVSNLHPPSYPDGNDVEVMTRRALETAWHEARRPHEREHTTPYLWDRPGRFRVGNVVWGAGRDLSMSHRFTVDYPQDHAFVARVYDALWRRDRPVFGLGDILRLLDAEPGLLRINAAFAGVNWYRHHLGELRTVGPEWTRQPQEAP